jgi:ligand-binding sensor domain-containing protein
MQPRVLMMTIKLFRLFCFDIYLCLQFAAPVRLYFCLLFQLLAMQVASQTPAKASKYSIRHYTSENGLPQNSVRAIARDADGFVWLATFEGLARFDGQHILAFTKGHFECFIRVF